MIIPINNGKSIIPVYIPDVTTNPITLQESNSDTQNNEPTLTTWFVLGVVLIFIIVFVVCIIKLLKDLGGEK